MPTEPDKRIQTICLLIISAVAIATGLYWMRPVMIPFIIAVFISLALTPLIVLLIRYLKVPRLMAIFLTLVLCFLGFAFLGSLVSSSIGAFNEKIQQEEEKEKIDQRLTDLYQRTVHFLSLDKLGIDPNQTFSLTQIGDISEEHDEAGESPTSVLGLLPSSVVRSGLLGIPNVIVDILSQGTT